MLIRASRVSIIQGEFHVSADPEIVISTLLGSCIAVCMNDPLAKVGGMNHFLLPGDGNSAHDNQGSRYGVHLMELLINGLLKLGASRDRLQAKVFGGANIVRGLGSIGSANAAFARHFLEREHISFAGGSMGGDQGRRVQFWPATGKAMQMFVAREEVVQVEAIKPAKADTSGELELF
jgi:chemotaxis protein CheD